MKDLEQRATAAPAQQNNGPKPLRVQVGEMEKAFALAMPKGMEAQQLVRDALTVIRQTPKLEQCAPETVLGALMTCAQLGLRPGVLGQAYLLPIWSGRNQQHEAQLIIGYQGLLELIYRSGQISMIDSRVIYENDEWLFSYGLERDELIHRPAITNRGKAIGFYSVARTKDGAVFVERPVTLSEMEEYRDRYAMAKKRDGTVVGPWVTEFEGMAKKTMIRQLAKRLPKSPEVIRAITHDGAVRLDPTPAAIDAAPEYIDATHEDVTPSDDAPATIDRPSLEDTVLVALDRAGVTDIAGYLSKQFGDKLTGLADLTTEELQGVLNVLATEGDNK